MSRSGYSDEMDDNWAFIMWRGRVASATRGKRGQQLLRDLLAALDAMPVKKLVAHEFVSNGEFCALGVVAAARGVKVDDIDPDSYEGSECSRVIAPRLDIAAPLAAEIMFMNDDDWRGETPEHRWSRMRQWVAEQIKSPTSAPALSTTEHER